MSVFSCDEFYILLPLIALLSILPPINPPFNGGLAIMPDFYAITRGGQTTVLGLNRIFLSLHKGPLLTGGVPYMGHGMAESKFRVVSHIFYDKCDTF